jgi:hypothetical protein
MILTQQRFTTLLAQYINNGHFQTLRFSDFALQQSNIADQALTVSNADIVGVPISNVPSVKFNGLNFTQVTFRNMTLNATDWQSCVFVSVTFKKTEFIEPNWENADFSDNVIFQNIVAVPENRIADLANRLSKASNLSGLKIRSRNLKKYSFLLLANALWEKEQAIRHREELNQTLLGQRNELIANLIEPSLASIDTLNDSESRRIITYTLALLDSSFPTFKIGLDKLIAGLKARLLVNQSEREIHEAVIHFLSTLLDTDADVPFNAYHYLALQGDLAGVITKAANAFRDYGAPGGGGDISQLRDGITGQVLEGWNTHDFLLIRLRFLIITLLRLETGHTKQLPSWISTDEAKNKLKLEIYLMTITFRFAAIHALLKGKMRTDQIQQGVFNNNLAKILCSLVAQLNPGKSLYLHSGFVGHVMYVNFIRHNQDIIIRIDNLLSDHSRYHNNPSPHSVTSKRDPAKTKIKVATRLLTAIPVKYFQQANSQCLTYLSDILKGPYLLDDLATNNIYEPTLTDVTSTRSYTNQFPRKGVQATGCCVVKNHNHGLMCRFFQPLKNRSGDPKVQRAFYRWFRDEEDKLAVEKAITQRHVIPIG